MTLRTMGGRGLLHLHELRPALVAALAPVDEKDPDVLDFAPDALAPPCLVVEWANPWLEPQTLGGLHGHWTARMNVVCFANRVELEGGIEKLQELVVYTLARLALAETRWPVVSVSNPRNFDMAGVTYLGARVTVQVPVTVEGGKTP